LKFYEAIYPLLASLHSDVKVGFMDDVTFAGDLQTVKRDIITISESHRETGLRLNTAKCEIIMEDFTMIDRVDMFKDFIRVNKVDMTLLGSPILKGKAQDKAIEQKTKDLSRAIDCLELLHAHDALVVLNKKLR